ncbi:hypothetical protein [Desulfobacula sp.]|uniref:Uncharacterized protein n=1 Tax=Candidatus Desulfatibia vada TaxID=2841696 RepID=A0A8J6TKQ6_9BACT|nr:hypothetical protein [Candidatus Desulfatibia vada]MBL6994163.1 hypothetical protein [Desulfobacula sp.]
MGSGTGYLADFFDDVIDGYGAQRHFGYFPRETSIKEALLGAGMNDVRVGTIPTPWSFNGRRDATWFVHELFGLGEAWNFESIPEDELTELANWLDHYLGFYQDKFGRTFFFWQLCYFYAQNL